MDLNGNPPELFTKIKLSVSYDKNSAQDMATILPSTCFFEKNVTSTSELDVKDAGLKLFKGWYYSF